MKITLPPKLKAWLIDVGERVGSSFGEAVIAAVSAGALAKGINATTGHVLLVAGLTAAAATLKGILAGVVHDTVSPASLAPKPQAKGVVQRIHRINEQPVTGKRLGRHVRHDPRSRKFAVTPQPLDTLKSVRHTRHVPVFDQGDVGSCTGNACAGALSTAPFRHKFSEHTAVEIYSAAETIDGDGPYPPNDNGSSGLSVAQVARSKGWISRYDHCFDLPSVLTALQTGPVLLGVSWLTGFDTPTKTGQMRVTGTVRGGHEICADEIDVANKRVWITNSWGPSWAVGGRAWWTWDDLAKILADSGDATVLVP